MGPGEVGRNRVGTGMTLAMRIRRVEPGWEANWKCDEDWSVTRLSTFAWALPDLSTHVPWRRVTRLTLS